MYIAFQPVRVHGTPTCYVLQVHSTQLNKPIIASADTQWLEHQLLCWNEIVLHFWACVSFHCCLRYISGNCERILIAIGKLKSARQKSNSMRLVCSCWCWRALLSKNPHTDYTAVHWRAFYGNDTMLRKGKKSTDFCNEMKKLYFPCKCNGMRLRSFGKIITLSIWKVFALVKDTVAMCYSYSYLIRT